MSKFLRIVTAAVAAGLIVAGLAGCESPHKFDVSPDEVVISKTTQKVKL